MKAINSMDAVYAHARDVLVFDSEIQRLSITETHPCELLVRLAYSIGWVGAGLYRKGRSAGQLTSNVLIVR